MIRVATHVHSDWSYDGSWTLGALAREFGSRGYDVVLMAEHDRGFDQSRWADYQAACTIASEGGALLVPGIEYSDAANLVHVAVWGNLPFLGEARATDELLTEVSSQRGVAILAHPDRREAWRVLDRDALCSLVGIEVWNRKYDGWAPSTVAIRLCEQESGLIPFFGLDFHTRRQLFPLAMIVDAEQSGTIETVVDALLERRCHPTALGIRGARLTQGAGLTAARSAEASRRFVRPVVRRWRRFRGRQPR